MDFNFIWYDCGDYERSCRHTTFDKSGFPDFRAAFFYKTFEFEKPLKSAKLFVSGDVRYFLWHNCGGTSPENPAEAEKMCADGFIGAGPAAAGGDFANVRPMPRHYYDSFETELSGTRLTLFARVYLPPDVMTDYSKGLGGFALRAGVTLEDGEVVEIVTDESWTAGLDERWLSTTEYDGSREPRKIPAKAVEDIWRPCVSGLEPLEWSYIQANGENGAALGEITVKPGESAGIYCDFPLICAGYPTFSVECAGGVEIEVGIRETPKYEYGRESVKLNKSCRWRSMRMFSVGGFELRIKNNSNSDAKIAEIGQWAVNYPKKTARYPENGDFSCSDEALNELYALGKHTLSICRQTLHLDSPLHQETLGCTGDYFIESRMNYATFGDPAVTRLDLIRTADWLETSGGFMFHTTYSLIWLQMLWDYYEYTADLKLLEYTTKAVGILLGRFESYVGESGTLENPPSFMFVDWCPIDGFNLHHPPMALGQSVLNAFWYKALLTASKIFQTLGEDEKAAKYQNRAEEVRAAFEIFWDERRGLYFDGLNKKYTPSQWLPENPDKRYFSVHTNILAALYGICGEKRAREIVRKALSEEDVTDFQPYFGFFVLEALKKTELFGEYGREVLKRWDVLLGFQKGLGEGWGEFQGDHSHAWGGCATYALPAYLSGFEMLEPGFKRFRLAPKLYWLDYADITLPLPGGSLECRIKRGERPLITLPFEFSEHPERAEIPDGCDVKFKARE